MQLPFHSAFAMYKSFFFSFLLISLLMDILLNAHSMLLLPYIHDACVIRGEGWKLHNFPGPKVL